MKRLVFDKSGSKAALIHYMDGLIAEMGNITWLQVDAAQEADTNGTVNLHHYVDLGQDDNLNMTKNMLHNAHSQCEKLIEGLLLPIGVESMSLMNELRQEEHYVTEIAVPGNFRQSDVELIHLTMGQYMMHYALKKWATMVAPQYIGLWSEELESDERQLRWLNKKRNQIVTSREMSAL